MTARQRLWVNDGAARIAVARWGEGDRRKPAALLVHGTGFVAEVWQDVAQALAPRYDVYALDRRGHGASHKPAAGQFHFLDFALDLCRVVETLELFDVLGVGHSAGATDLLLAAGALPGRFSRIFAMEPTVMDPRVPGRDGAQLSDARRSTRERVLRRRSEFASRSEAIARFRAAPAFAHWSNSALEAYVCHAFEAQPDGRIRLLCTPEIEAAMLLPIFEAMEGIYAGDERGNPFHELARVRCPVRISTAERSAAIYAQMAGVAVELIPGASSWRFAGVGHSVAQEEPALLLDALDAFVAS